MIIGICNFDIVCYLSIVIWDFSAVSGKVNRFYLTQLALALTFLLSHQLLPIQKMDGVIFLPRPQGVGQKLRDTEIRILVGCGTDGNN